MKFISNVLFCIVLLVGSFMSLSQASPIMETKEVTNLINPMAPQVLATAAIKCIADGGPCNVSDVCCSNRCLFYAHKCMVNSSLSK